MIEQVTAEMDLRAAAVQKLQQEAVDAEATKSLSAEQHEALRHLVESTLRPETNRAIKWAWISGVFGILTGAGITVAITLFVHPLH